MALAPVTCPRCRAALPAGTPNLAVFARCPGCGNLLQVEVFPALFRPITAGSVGETVMIEGEASCFYHPLKKAVVPCDACGRFLCALCDCDLSGQHLCPSCLDTGQQKDRLPHLQTQRSLHDNITLALAVLPLLIFYFTIFTAPIVLFLVIRHWNTPGSLVPRTKVRFVIAAILAVLEIVGCGVLIWFLVRGLR
jgi:hypothetical protein